MSERYEALVSRPSIFSAGASHAKTSATLDVVPALGGTTADYGLSSPVWLANFDPATCLWRTLQRSLFGDLMPFSQTWPRSGSMRSGKSFRLPPAAPRTYELASGFWPTPVASESKRTTPYSQGGNSLAFVLGGMPNPRWLEWLMGFPLGWTLVRWETRSSRRSRSGSDGA